MKTTFLFATLFMGYSAFAAEADSTGLEGDHLDLYAVMELFKDSDSPEDFETKLNTESSKVNNLDLDGDGNVDYISVIDSGDSISHVLTLQVSVTESESQDVATIELEETADDVVQIQIVGDEDLYGANYILTPESAGKSPAIVNVIDWRPVRFMWTPGYVLWVSPWRHRHYPGWFKPWKRKRWHVYHGHVSHHHRHYRRVNARIITHAHAHHYHRTHSVTFHKHHHVHQTSGKTAGKTTGTTSEPNTSQKGVVNAKNVKATEGISGSSSEATERKRPGSISTESGNSKKGSEGTTKSNEKGTKTKNDAENKASKTNEKGKKAKNDTGGKKGKSKTTKTKTNGAGKTKTKSRSGKSGRKKG